MTSERRARKKAESRRRILDEAFALFSRRGLYGPKIDDITEAADIGKGTFYLHFPSKEALLKEVVHEGIEKLKTNIQSRLNSAGPALPPIEAIIGAHADFFKENPSYILLFHQARGWLKLPGHEGGAIREEFMAYLGELESVISGHFSSPSGGAPDPSWLSRTIAGCIAGIFSFDTIAGSDLPSSGEISSRIRALSAMLPSEKDDAGRPRKSGGRGGDKA